MEFSIISGNDSMECEPVLEGFDKFHEIAEEEHVNVCALAPNISALLKDRQLWYQLTLGGDGLEGREFRSFFNSTRHY